MSRIMHWGETTRRLWNPGFVETWITGARTLENKVAFRCEEDVHSNIFDLNKFLEYLALQDLELETNDKVYWISSLPMRRLEVTDCNSVDTLLPWLGKSRRPWNPGFVETWITGARTLENKVAFRCSRYVHSNIFDLEKFIEYLALQTLELGTNGKAYWISSLPMKKLGVMNRTA